MPVIWSAHSWNMTDQCRHFTTVVAAEQLGLSDQGSYLIPAALAEIIEE
jgi:hypothetical protein